MCLSLPTIGFSRGFAGPNSPRSKIRIFLVLRAAPTVLPPPTTTHNDTKPTQATTKTLKRPIRRVSDAYIDLQLLTMRGFPWVSSCLLLFLRLHSVAASSGSPFFRHPAWRPAPSATLDHRPSHARRPSSSRSLSPRAEQYLAKIAMEEALIKNRRFPPRGGQDSDAFVKAVGTVTSVLIQCGKLILPPTVAITKAFVGIYRALPKDAILAQVGLVYCFAGGCDLFFCLG